MISFTVPGTPVPLQRAGRRNSGGTYLPTRSRNYRKAIQGEWQAVGSPRLGSAPVTLGVRFYKRTKRGDLSNFLKAVEDALNGCAYEDDRQIVRYEHCTIERSEDERTEIKLWRALERAA